MSDPNIIISIVGAFGIGLVTGIAMGIRYSTIKMNEQMREFTRYITSNDSEVSDEPPWRKEDDR